MISKLSNNKITRILLLVVLLVTMVVGLFILNKYTNDEQNRTPNDGTDRDPLTGETINYGPPSEDEIKAGEMPQNEETENNDLNKGVVTPIISTWTQNRETKNLEVNGFVPAMVEDGGTCALTLRRNGAEIKKIKLAQADAQTTTCGIIEVERGELSAGKWTATITYSSIKYGGTSAEVEMEII